MDHALLSPQRPILPATMDRLPNPSGLVASMVDTIGRLPRDMDADPDGTDAVDRVIADLAVDAPVRRHASPRPVSAAAMAHPWHVRLSTGSEQERLDAMAALIGVEPFTACIRPGQAVSFGPKDWAEWAGSHGFESHEQTKHSFVWRLTALPHVILSVPTSTGDFRSSMAVAKQLKASYRTALLTAIVAALPAIDEDPTIGDAALRTVAVEAACGGGRRVVDATEIERMARRCRRETTTDRGADLAAAVRKLERETGKQPKQILRELVRADGTLSQREGDALVEVLSIWLRVAGASPPPPGIGGLVDLAEEALEEVRALNHAEAEDRRIKREERDREREERDRERETRRAAAAAEQERVALAKRAEQERAAERADVRAAVAGPVDAVRDCLRGAMDTLRREEERLIDLALQHARPDPRVATMEARIADLERQVAAKDADLATARTETSAARRDVEVTTAALEEAKTDAQGSEVRAKVIHEAVVAAEKLLAVQDFASIAANLPKALAVLRTAAGA